MTHQNNELIRMGSELIQAPQVVLSERAFEHAQNAGIAGIAHNLDGMLTVCQITEMGSEYIPDLTIIRDGKGSVFNWDKTYKNAPDTFPYAPSYELDKAERSTSVSAGNLRAHQLQTGKTILELTVKDWDGLGEELAGELAWQMKEAQNLAASKPEQGAGLAQDATAWFGRIFNAPTMSNRDRAVAAARAGAQPYTVSLRQQ
jgi:hypothetical protein